MGTINHHSRYLVMVLLHYVCLIVMKISMFHAYFPTISTNFFFPSRVRRY